MGRLPVYLRALVDLRRGRRRHRLERRARRGGGRELREGTQRPVPPGLVRHAGRRLRRRLPDPPDPPRARSHPALADRDRRHRQPRAGARELRGLRRAGVPRGRARRRRPRQGGGAGRGARGPSRRATLGDRGRVRRGDRRDRDPRERRAGRRRSVGRRRRPLGPELRAGDRSRCRPGCRCARSTWRSSCRSSPSTSSARRRSPR